MSPGAALIEEKRALRRAMRAARDALSPTARAEATVALGAALAGLPEFSAAGTISAFAAAGSEVDLRAAMDRARAAGVRVVYPRVDTGASPRLRFHAVAGLADLVPGAYGILEPTANLPEVAVESIEVIVMPGLAFDARGRRLGYGGGYYDEVAARVRAAGRGFLLGVGYDFQLIDTVPAGEGDVAIDCVVTDARLVRCQ